MRKSRAPAARAALLAVLALLALPQIPPAEGAEARTVAQFSDGSSEVVFRPDPDQDSNLTNLTIARNAVVLSAGVSIEGLPGRDGACPQEAQLRLGNSSVWDFGVTQGGTGEMGRQTVFSGGRESVSFQFPPEGGCVTRPGPLLPTGAEVKEAKVEVAMAPGPLPAVVYRMAEPPAWVFWDDDGSTVVQVSIADGRVEFSGEDAITGSLRWSRQVRPGLPGGAFVADIQYLAETDRVALLVPGEGVLVVNLTTGLEQEFFTGPEAASLQAMRFSRDWLAVLGRGWASVRDLVEGAEDRVNSTLFPQASWYEPVAVDYDRQGRRLIIASRGHYYFNKDISVFTLNDGKVRLFSDESVTSNMASMVYVPEMDGVMLGLTGHGSVEGFSNDRTAMSISLSDGAVGYPAAFDGFYSISSISRRGDLLCALGESLYGGPVLALLDVNEWSWRTFPGLGAEWSPARSWAYDPAAMRVLTVSYSGAIDIFELDFALESGMSWRLPSLAGPVPGQVTAILAIGGDILAGTDNGLAAISADGRRNWTIGCGRVDALASDPVSGRALVAALDGLRCGPGAGRWDAGTLNLLELDLGGIAPQDRGLSVRLPAEWLSTTIQGIAACPRNGTLYLSVSSYPGSGLYEVGLDGSLTRIQTPSVSVGALALSPDGLTLYAACRGAGMLVMDVATGAQELLTPFSEAALLSPGVTSIEVDRTGAVLVGQYPSSGYFPGGVSLLSRPANGTMETLFSSEIQGRYVSSATRDIAGGRIFVTSQSALLALDEKGGTPMELSGDLHLSSVQWSADGNRLVGLGGGAAIALCWTSGMPADVGLDVGGDGTAGWSGPKTPGRPELVDITDDLARFLSVGRTGQRFVEVPLRVVSGSAALVQLRSLSVSYRLSERVDLRETLAGYLRALPETGEVKVPLAVTSSGGALRLHGLDITFEPGAAPRARSVPEVRLDAGAAAPTILDLSKFYTDERSPASNLSFRLEAATRPSGVSLTILFGRYLVADARGTSFRGAVKATVTTADEQGLTVQTALRLRVFRSGEYVPPPAYYGTLAWVFAAAVLVLAILALRLYVRGLRKRE